MGFSNKKLVWFGRCPSLPPFKISYRHFACTYTSAETKPNDPRLIMTVRPALPQPAHWLRATTPKNWHSNAPRPEAIVFMVFLKSGILGLMAIGSFPSASDPFFLRNLQVFIMWAELVSTTKLLIWRVFATWSPTHGCVTHRTYILPWHAKSPRDTGWALDPMSCLVPGLFAGHLAMQ